MFDDPKKDLKWLEQQLLAAEQDQEEPEEDWPEEEQDWLETELQEARVLLGDVPARRSEPEDVFRFLEEDVREAETRSAYASAPKRKSRKEKGTRGLVILACLETAAILAVLLWWVKWLL